MNLDGCGEDDLRRRGQAQALFIGECFQRLATLQFRAPRVATIFVLFNHHADQWRPNEAAR